MNLPMSGRKAWRRNKLLAAMCGAGAMLLIAAGLIGGAPETEEWIPLNEAVKSSLDAMNGSADPVPSSNVTHQEEVYHDEQQPGNTAGFDLVAEEPDDPVGPASDTMPPSPETPVLTSRDELGRLDLNRATADELMELKGIGPSKAQAITDDRERNGKFKSVEDLIRVKGIGAKLLDGIKESVVARP